MRHRPTARIAALLLASLTSSAIAGCELAVELDRSAVDAGGDSGCAICSPTTDAEEDSARRDAGSADSNADAVPFGRD
jgi:hypothetical protein